MRADKDLRPGAEPHPRGSVRDAAAIRAAARSVESGRAASGPDTAADEGPRPDSCPTPGQRLVGASEPALSASVPVRKGPEAPGSSRPRRLAPWVVAFVCWVAFIWGHSLVQGPSSTAESNRVVALIAPLFRAAGVFDESLMRFIVRKTAHFSEYAVLGVIARGMFARVRERVRVPLWACALAVAVVPCADEFIQLFVPGRSAMLRDVCIDLAGAATGALVAYAVARRRSRRRA